MQPSSIDDIFGPSYGIKAAEARKFKESFGSSSATLARNRPSVGGCTSSRLLAPPAHVEMATPLPIPTRPQPPFSRSSEAVPAAVDDSTMNPRHSLLRDARTVTARQEQAQQAAAAPKPVPSYLRPRAHVRSQEEMESEAMLRRARGLVQALEQMESVRT